ncbi:M28 family metallopeptidase [Alloiococcus sp. CFN-8]|uniref:M28 family metallopeptidase n=1 Tax=Alloiococcus sp. CFN-8 TaxID=3416081 RepID=UPI003CE9F4B6
MVRKLAQFLITLFLISFCFFYIYHIKLKAFDTEKVMEHIEFLSSDNLEGRLTGTFENKIAGDYIQNTFIKYGLRPFSESYYQSFRVKYPALTSETPVLEAVGPQGISKVYEYGVDYKEDLLNFDTVEIYFDKTNASYSDKYIQIKKDNHIILLVATAPEEFSFRSSYISDAPYSLYISISDSCFEELLLELREGYTIHLKVPYEVKETNVDNLHSLLPGMNKDKPPLIISSHFDHLGSDYSGTIYPGALDNASGTAFVLELARYFKNLGASDGPMIFAAFNAEEFGCLGSKAFAEQYYDQIKKATVYNFDMIGSDKELDLTIMGGKNDNPSTEQVASIISNFDRRNIDYKLSFEDSSDHEYFRKVGISAVTLIHEDMDRIHTPEDTVSYISEESIKEAFKTVSEELIEKNYRENLLIFYNVPGLIFSIFAAIAISLIYINRRS